MENQNSSIRQWARFLLMNYVSTFTIVFTTAAIFNVSDTNCVLSKSFLIWVTVTSLFITYGVWRFSANRD